MGSRKEGTNPRALGKSPRQLGISPRQLAEKAGDRPARRSAEEQAAELRRKLIGP